VEVWSKNIIMDRALGFQYILLDSLPYNQYDYPTGFEQWFNIDAEQIIQNGEVQGTRNPTGHTLLLDLHFELPFEDVDAQGDLQQNKIGFGGDFTNQEQYIENYNEYSEYQTDLSYQNQSSYGKNYGHLPTPHSSLETSRQNSYERDERQYYDINNFYNGQFQDQVYSPTCENGEMNEGDYDDGALYYNSRPFK
jgi:hypothetical protein